MRYFVLILISSINLYSQEMVEKDSLWTTRGNVAVLLNQTGFSDWVGGGTNNFSGTLKFDYEWEFKDKGWDWLTNVESAFGLAKYKNAPFARKIDDRILIQSIVGKEFTKNLSFSAFFNFTSQIGNGFKYKKDSENNEIRELTTRIFSPAYFQLGSGFLWKKDESLWVNYSPIAARLILVSKTLKNLAKLKGVKFEEKKKAKEQAEASHRITDLARRVPSTLTPAQHRVSDMRVFYQRALLAWARIAIVTVERVAAPTSDDMCSCKSSARLMRVSETATAAFCVATL